MTRRLEYEPLVVTEAEARAGLHRGLVSAAIIMLVGATCALVLLAAAFGPLWR
jgi:hypothetical protein